MQAVRVRAAGATHEGPRRSANDDAFGVLEEDGAAFAVVASGIARGRGGRLAADVVVERALEVFRGRRTATLDDLAETWWTAEHAAEAGTNRRYATLPIGDRVQLRERVRLVLEKRHVESMGDVAVVDAERRTLFDLPRRALDRANAALHARTKEARWSGLRAVSACALFVDGHVAIAHVGDCRVSRVVDTAIESLTVEHTVRNIVASGAVNPPPGFALDQLPDDTVVRVLGMDRVEIDVKLVPLVVGERILLMTEGLYRTFSDDDLRAAIVERGAGAATYLVHRGKHDRPGHPGKPLTAVVVEITGME